MSKFFKLLLILSILFGMGLGMKPLSAQAASETGTTFRSEEEPGVSSLMMQAPLAGILHTMPIRTDDLIMNPINPMGSFHSRMIQQVQLHSMMKQLFNGVTPLPMEPVGLPKRFSKPY